MVDIHKEGFIKVIPRSNELKNYFFYLTFNNRADISIYKNPIELKGKLHSKKEIITDKGNLNLFYSYLESTKSEFKGNQIKALELIMSYSTDFNKLMIDIYGLPKWKNIYSNVLNKLLQKFFKDNKMHLNYIHTYDSQGIRIHNHTLLYPYKLDYSSQSYQLFTYIPEDVLNNLKKEYNLISRQLIKKNINKIRYIKKKNDNPYLRNIK